MKCLQILNENDIQQALAPGNEDRFKIKLYETVDGKPLREFTSNLKGQHWISGHPELFSGKSYRELVKLRIGRLPTLENSNRGRDVEKQCRKCTRVKETLSHVIKKCPFTHFNRIIHHNKVAEPSIYRLNKVIPFSGNHSTTLRTSEEKSSPTL